MGTLGCRGLSYGNLHVRASLDDGSVATTMICDVVRHGTLKSAHLILAILMRIIHIARLIVLVAIASLALTEIIHIASLLAFLFVFLFAWATFAELQAQIDQ